MLNIYNIPGAELQSPMAGIARPVHEAHNSQQVIAQAGLDWAVIGKPLRTIDGQEIDSHKAMIRSDTSHCLGVVGVGYQALQNAEAFAFWRSDPSEACDLSRCGAGGGFRIERDSK